MSKFSTSTFAVLSSYFNSHSYELIDNSLFSNFRLKTRDSVGMLSQKLVV